MPKYYIPKSRLSLTNRSQFFSQWIPASQNVSRSKIAFVPKELFLTREEVKSNYHDMRAEFYEIEAGEDWQPKNLISSNVKLDLSALSKIVVYKDNAFIDKENEIRFNESRIEPVKEYLKNVINPAIVSEKLDEYIKVKFPFLTLQEKWGFSKLQYAFSELFHQQKRILGDLELFAKPHDKQELYNKAAAVDDWTRTYSAKLNQIACLINHYKSGILKNHTDLLVNLAENMEKLSEYAKKHKGLFLGPENLGVYWVLHTLAQALGHSLPCKQSFDPSGGYDQGTNTPGYHCQGRLYQWRDQIVKHGQAVNYSVVDRKTLLNHYEQVLRVLGAPNAPAMPVPLFEFALSDNNITGLQRLFNEVDDAGFFRLFLRANDGQEGHVLGLRKVTGSNMVEIFDPNIGEFIFPNQELAIAWTQFCLLIYKESGFGAVILDKMDGEQKKIAITPDFEKKDLHLMFKSILPDIRNLYRDEQSLAFGILTFLSTAYYGGLILESSMIEAPFSATNLKICYERDKDKAQEVLDLIMQEQQRLAHGVEPNDIGKQQALESLKQEIDQAPAWVPLASIIDHWLNQSPVSQQHAAHPAKYKSNRELIDKPTIGNQTEQFIAQLKQKELLVITLEKPVQQLNAAPDQPTTTGPSSCSP